MAKKKVGLALFLIFALHLLIGNVAAQPEDWFTGYSYRKSHLIEATSGAGTNYQIKIVVHNGSGTDSGENVYITNVQDDFDDIRFTTSDGITEYDYWMEEKNDASNATFWVEISDDLSANVQIYMYYGNASASTTSDGEETFPFFDDFPGSSLNTTKWVGDTSNASVSDSILTYDNTVGALALLTGNYTLYSFSYNYAVRGLVKINATESGTMASWGWRNSTGDYLATFWGTSTSTRIRAGDGSIDSELSDWTEDAYQLWEVQRDSTSYARYVENGTEVLNSPLSANIPGQVLPPCFTAWEWGLSADWTLVRKYVNPEPAHLTWGQEEEYGDYGYTFHGLYNEADMSFDPTGVNVTAYWETGTTPTTFEVNGTYTRYFGSKPEYFHFEFGDLDRQYYLGVDEDSGDIWIFNQSLTTYTVNFLDLAGILNTYPYVGASRYVNGILYLVEKRQVDEQNKIQFNLINGAKYTITIRDGSTYYTWGELLMTSDTSITLTLKGVEFPKETLLTYKNIRIYGLREFANPNGSISITYEDLLSLTTKVDIYMYDENDTGVYNTTLTSQSFVHTWTEAANSTDYKVTCYIYHERYGTREWKQYFPRTYSTAPWGLGFLGETLPFATSAILPAFIILFVAGCFSVINAQLGAFMAVVTAVALVYLGWISIGSGTLIAAFAFAVLMALNYAKRRVTY